MIWAEDILFNEDKHFDRPFCFDNASELDDFDDFNDVWNFSCDCNYDKLNEYFFDVFQDNEKTFKSYKNPTTVHQSVHQIDRSAPTNKKRKLKKPIEKQLKKKTRINFYREIDTSHNKRLRAAVYLYRFSKNKLGFLRKKFDIPSKTLMRYVEHSCNQEFLKYNLYFGDKGIVKYDKALPKNKRVVLKNQQLPEADIPELAKHLINLF